MPRETWDLYDRDGNRTGLSMVRGEPTPPGLYHLVVHVWPFDGRGRLLIQRRADHLAWLPGIWAGTGGSAVQGEDSLAAAMRETAEELGLELDREALVFGARLVRKDSFADLWFARVAEHEKQGITPGEEVAAVRWVRLEDIPDLVEEGTFYDYGADYLEAVRRHRP